MAEGLQLKNDTAFCRVRGLSVGLIPCMTRFPYTGLGSCGIRSLVSGQRLFDCWGGRDDCPLEPVGPEE